MNPDFVKALLDSATIIGAFLGIPALIIAIISLVVSVRRKRLVYTRIGFTKISAIDQERSDKITVDFDRTKEIYIRFFEVKNNGLIPIGSSDFDKPLRFSFGAGTNLVLNVQTKESES